MQPRVYGWDIRCKAPSDPATFLARFNIQKYTSMFNAILETYDCEYLDGNYDRFLFGKDLVVELKDKAMLTPGDMKAKKGPLHH